MKGKALTRSNLLLWTKQKERAVVRVVRIFAIKILATSQQLTPVDTGRLRASQHIEELLGGLAALIGTNVTYAYWVHFGTTRMSGRPFLLQAFELHAQEFYNALKAAMK